MGVTYETFKDLVEVTASPMMRAMHVNVVISVRMNQTDLCRPENVDDMTERLTRRLYRRFCERLGIEPEEAS